jgi:phage tail sheath gpL-like
LNARLQQVIAGLTTTIALGTAATPDANGFQNDGVGELALCVNGRGLPGELAGREVGGWLLGLSTDPAVNRIGEQLTGYIGSSDINADTPSESESETALGNGVSIVSYTAQGLEIIVRPITTHSQTDTGAPDRRLLDGQNVAGAYIVARDIRDNLPLAFPQAKITPDTEPGSDPPQKGVTEERDIKAWVIARLKGWDVEGVVQRDALQEAIDDGSLIVEVDSGDPTQVNLVLPYSILQPLAKFGVVAQRVPN